MNEQKLDAYIDALDRAGQEFSVNFQKYDQVKEDPGSLKLGGIADIALGRAITAANEFAAILKSVSEDRPSFFTSSKVKATREKVISHSRANLTNMNRQIDGVPKSLRQGAEMSMMMNLLRGK